MIVKIKYGQPQIRVRLSDDAEPPGSFKKFILSIKPISELPCDFMLPSKWIVEGCWPEYEGPRHTCHPSPPSLMYPAFDQDCDGNVIFLLDDKLRALPTGRYDGEITTTDGRIIGSLDIDIIDTPYIIRHVEVVEGVQP